MTDLREATNYLGAVIHKRKDGIFINQKGYINKLLHKFGLQQCNSTKLPMDPHVQLQKNMGIGRTDPLLYRSLVGSLIYLSNTRPDICYAVSCVTQYMDQPELAHFQVAKKILRYLSGTLDYGIFMPFNSTNLYHTYTDADWGRDLDSRRSTSGILHKLGDSSIFWTSKLQPTVSLSSTEAEYHVLTDAAKDILYFKRLLSELGLDTTAGLSHPMSFGKITSEGRRSGASPRPHVRTNVRVGRPPRRTAPAGRPVLPQSAQPSYRKTARNIITFFSPLQGSPSSTVAPRVTP
jgi:hypothetical protein